MFNLPHLQSGDQIVVGIQAANDSSFVIPTGWTVVTDYRPSTSWDPRVVVLRRAAVAGESTVTIPTGYIGKTGVAIAYCGLDPTAPVIATTTASVGGTSLTVPGLTPGVLGARLFSQPRRDSPPPPAGSSQRHHRGRRRQYPAMDLDRRRRATPQREHRNRHPHCPIRAIVRAERRARRTTACESVAERRSPRCLAHRTGSTSAGGRGYRRGKRCNGPTARRRRRTVRGHLSPRRCASSRLAATLRPGSEACRTTTSRSPAAPAGDGDPFALAAPVP